MGQRCVIFDCDGTLVETEGLECSVFADMLVAEGYPITPAEVLNRYRGTKKDAVLCDIEKHLGRALDRDAFIATWRHRAEAIFAKELVAVNGAMDLVSNMTAPFCIASNGPLSKMKLTLQVTGLRMYFDDRIFSAYEVGSWKPAPELFLHAARAMGVNPTDCLVVEDSEPGVMAGLAAGMSVLAYQPEPDSPPLSEGATVIRHLREVTQFLEMK